MPSPLAIDTTGETIAIDDDNAVWTRFRFFSNLVSSPLATLTAMKCDVRAIIWLPPPAGDCAAVTICRSTAPVKKPKAMLET